MNRTLTFLSVPLISLLLAACATTPADHQQNLQSTKEREMTVGIVQKEIKEGMSQAEVAEALGSPNIVTKDKEGFETWVYDKIASEVSYSSSTSSASGAIGAGGVPGTTLLIGGIGGSTSRQSGAASSTQKTLTVVIHFDDNGAVKSFSYHGSKF